VTSSTSAPSTVVWEPVTTSDFLNPPAAVIRAHRAERIRRLRWEAQAYPDLAAANARIIRALEAEDLSLLRIFDERIGEGHDLHGLYQKAQRQEQEQQEQAAATT
jgi:hypothetical protein